jgi:hypothetical protein
VEGIELDRDILEGIFKGFEQLALMAAVLLVVVIVTVPLAICKLVDLLW